MLLLARRIGLVRDRWFRRRGIETKRSPGSVWEAIGGLTDPDELSWRYQSEETAGGSRDGAGGSIDNESPVRTRQPGTVMGKS
jgi:hypothetical protein